MNLLARRLHVSTAPGTPFCAKLLSSFEELNFLFVLLCGFTRVERAQVSTFACFRVLLFRVQAIPA
jgi:hypothetical protein